MKKSLFVVNIGNYRPDLCEYTIPTIRHWARKNSWDLRFITERKFEGVSITAEKLQVYELGRDSDWNLTVDADLLLRPDLVDPSTVVKEEYVFSSYGFKNSARFSKLDSLLRADLRNHGISGGFYGGHKTCLELWRPPANADEWIECMKGVAEEPHIIDEYVVARNLARHRFQVTGFCDFVDSFIVHLGTADKTEEEKLAGVERAKKVWEEWCLIWPELKQSKELSLLSPLANPTKKF